MGVLIGILIALSIIGVVGALGVGIFAMIKGGDFNRKYGNKLMRARVGFQAMAILMMILLALVYKGHS